MSCSIFILLHLELKRAAELSIYFRHVHSTFQFWVILTWYAALNSSYKIDYDSFNTVILRIKEVLRSAWLYALSVRNYESKCYQFGHQCCMNSLSNLYFECSNTCWKESIWSHHFNAEINCAFVQSIVDMDKHDCYCLLRSYEVWSNSSDMPKCACGRAACGCFAEEHSETEFFTMVILCHRTENSILLLLVYCLYF